MSVRIGEILVKQGKLTPEQLAQAVEQSKAQGGLLLGVLPKLGFIEEGDLTGAISSHFGVPIVELEGVSFDSALTSIIPQALAQKHTLIPIVQKDSKLSLAVADPTNMVALNDIKFITGLDIEVHVASERSIKAAQDKLYEQQVSYDSLLDEADGGAIEIVDTKEEVDVAALERATEDAPVVKLVNALLTDAIKKGASDIHVEPYEKVFRVRFRIDGVLHEIMKPPPKLKNAMTSRLKIMSELDIAERRLPQDGRIKLKIAGGKEMDFRVNVLPTLFGEKVVLRLLDKSNLQLDMRKLGFEEKQLSDFMEAISKPHGMVLVTGPTGSGKTTTLYSALAELNKEDTNISTAEDPVEFNLPGINQAQMNEEIGFNFAAALRAFLRQDPDVIMVGEIRDYETAEIAIKASLTGHLVLSTLHTNDAPSTVSRLLNMGVEPFLVASSVNCIVAQRLARKMCQHCAAEYDEDIAILISLGISPEEAATMKVKKGKGCEKCSNTGYKGRIALYEVMAMGEELKEMVLSGAAASDLKKRAGELGMMTLRASGLLRLRQGVTTVEEVLRSTVDD
jgi:type IV pilus assembly protein PilB